MNKKIINKIKKLWFKFLGRNIKIGVSYNIFDGEELLPFSIKSVRRNVQYINVVYQTVSNFGNSANPDLEEKLKKLTAEGLVDEIYKYEPDFALSPHQNEKNKRNIGLELAKKRHCNYFLSMDADEFYDEEQFKQALDYIIENNIATSAASIIEYLKSPENQIIGNYTFIPEKFDLYNFYVPFIIKINRFKEQFHGEDYFPCATDPTRTLFHRGKFRLFSPQELAMHHMSTVRLDLNKKYDNSSLLNSDKDFQENVRKIQSDILNFDFETNKALPDNCAVFRKSIVQKVVNKFGINL
ncbi:MAG: hypothetical protein PHC64_07530 [Candidatus Gastranaerophilales bacterium]|nr:hypothetical protein [Candidatus Gastranaerophilales bacterium]